MNKILILLAVQLGDTMKNNYCLIIYNFSKYNHTIATL